MPGTTKKCATNLVTNDKAKNIKQTKLCTKKETTPNSALDLLNQVWQNVTKTPEQHRQQRKDIKFDTESFCCFKLKVNEFLVMKFFGNNLVVRGKCLYWRKTMLRFNKTF